MWLLWPLPAGTFLIIGEFGVALNVNPVVRLAWVAAYDPRNLHADHFNGFLLLRRKARAFRTDAPLEVLRQCRLLHVIAVGFGAFACDAHAAFFFTRFCGSILEVTG